MDVFSFIVICDDLTGSSDQSILLKERGLSVYQMVRFEPGMVPNTDADVLVINSDSRRRSPLEVSRIYDAILSMWPAGTRYTKRIDTTLRGHILLETAKLIERDRNRVALVVPAFPASGRTTIGGFQLLNGELLERTEVSRDPLWPIKSSYVPGYFEDSYSVGRIIPEDLLSDPHGLSDKMSAISAENRVIVADAQNDSDIELLAMAAARSGVDFVPVDPSPFTSAYIYHTIHKGSQKPVMAVIGSTSEKTRKQIFFLRDKLRIFDVEVGPDGEKSLCPLKTFDPQEYDMLLVHAPSEIVHGMEDLIARSLAESASKRIAGMTDTFCGVVLSGGDTAVRFFEEADVLSISSEEEIEPLMIGAVVNDGPLKGLKTVTKGGLVGEEDAIYKAVAWLRKKRR